MTQSKVFAFMDAAGMIHPGDTVIAGVSGGADSVAMLALLVRCRQRIPFTLKVLHVHHGIRGAEADGDESFVKSLCERWEIPFVCRRYDVPELAARWKLGEEETGRIVRRQAFSEEAAASGTPADRVRIALAHHRNDVAETMLFHLCRGTGLRGLAAMKPVSGNRIRPLLLLDRREIEEFLSRERIPYRTDSTNLSEQYTRNRIRRQILPLLSEYVNPETVRHMSDASRRLGEAEEYLVAQGRACLAEYGKKENETWFLGAGLSARPRIEGSYAVREALESMTGKSRDLEACHIDQILSLFQKQNGRRICLPYGLEAERVYEGVLLKQRSSQSQEEDLSVPVLIPGVTKVPGGTVETVLISCSGEQILEKKYTKWLDYDKIRGQLLFRTRRRGDYLPLSENGPDKLLRRYFIDCKIPAKERDRIPFFAVDSHVVWIPGRRISGRCKVSASTRTVLQIHLNID